MDKHDLLSGHHGDSPQRMMLKFSSMAPELERVNELGYRLPLNDTEIKRMQNLNRAWASSSAQTTERFRYTRTHTGMHTHTHIHTHTHTRERVGEVPQGSSNLRYIDRKITTLLIPLLQQWKQKIKQN